MSKKLINHFRDKGFVTYPGVFEASEIEYYSLVLKEAIKERKQADLRKLVDKSLYEQSFTQCQNLWEDYLEIRKLTFSNKITSIAAELLGVERLRLWHDQALVKESGGRKTDIHHDKPYWPIRENQTITAWIPLSKIDSNNGQLGFYPASHKHLEEEFIDIFSGDIQENQIKEIMAIKGVEPEYQDLEIGDVSFHHGLVFHEAKANNSLEDRVVHTAIYFAEGSIRDSDKFHFSVDRPGIGVGEVIASDVTPIAYPIKELPKQPETPINKSFEFLQELGLLPKN
jgi:ectoine hydroxylase-related dioxygenase (phytanoyl-CoA dioxygenase family)